jgi:aryl-alcohol dehydrogenase-like predicted oxidoreductase
MPAMETRRIGALEVSVVGLGCNNFGGRIDEVRTREVIDAALDADITLFDTADNYGASLSETFIGRALAGRRDRVVLATKFGGWNRELGRETGGSAANVRASVEASLRRLDTDRIDLFQLHSPDADTPIAETLGALDELVREGKVREIGCSNLSAAQLREADGAPPADATRFVSVQNELSLLARDDLGEGLAEAARLGLAYLPYFPLASGLLTGKIRRGEPVPDGTRIAGWPADRRDETLTDATFGRLEALERFADGRGHAILELAFGWLLAQAPVASVIAGATSGEQVRANVAAGEWRLTADELAAVPD